MKRTLSLLLVISLSLIFTSQTVAQSKQKAPNFALKTAKGKVYELNKLRGKVVIVNFWATWCMPCKMEIPDFIKIYKKYKSKGLELIGVSTDEGGWNDVNPFVKENNINYPIVLANEKVTADYGGIPAIPMTFIIDRKGDIVFQRVGMLTKAQLESKLKPLL